MWVHQWGMIHPWICNMMFQTRNFMIHICSKIVNCTVPYPKQYKPSKIHHPTKLTSFNQILNFRLVTIVLEIICQKTFVQSVKMKSNQKLRPFYSAIANIILSVFKMTWLKCQRRILIRHVNLVGNFISRISSSLKSSSKHWKNRSKSISTN